MQIVTPSKTIATLALFLVTSVISISTVFAASEEDQKTWNLASVFLPNSKEPLMMGDPEVQKWMANRKNPVGVYLFLHGSGGMNAEGKKLKNTFDDFAELGYIVIAPNSFARDNRRINDTVGIYQTRWGEINYALEQIHRAKWADQRRIVIHGQSEGAWTLSSYSAGGYTAAIITGFGCQVSGLRTPAIPREVEILSFSDPADPNYLNHPTVRGVGTCKNVLADRPNAKVVEMPGKGHSIFSQPEGRELINDMLKRLNVEAGRTVRGGLPASTKGPKGG